LCDWRPMEPLRPMRAASASETARDIVVATMHKAISNFFMSSS
jgi:hypothetical protein